MVGNGSQSYDHDQDGRPTELGGCAAALRNAIHDTFLLVRYSRNTLTVRVALPCVRMNARIMQEDVRRNALCSLQLMVDVDGKLEWKNCALVNGLRLPRGYYFGASSATGDLTGERVSTRRPITAVMFAAICLPNPTPSPV